MLQVPDGTGLLQCRPCRKTKAVNSHGYPNMFEIIFLVKTGGASRNEFVRERILSFEDEPVHSGRPH